LGFSARIVLPTAMVSRFLKNRRWLVKKGTICLDQSAMLSFTLRHRDKYRNYPNSSLVRHRVLTDERSVRDYKKMTSEVFAGARWLGVTGA
jgi:hypothetical protein